MANLGNQKIKDTYQLVLQTDASGNLQNLSGGTPNPFIVNGNLRYVDGSQALDYILTSDASGNATWQTPGHSTSYWSANTDGSITPSGFSTSIGIGTSTPNEKLTVVGDISATTDVHAAKVITTNDVEVGGKLNLTALGTAYISLGASNKLALGSTSILYSNWKILDGSSFAFDTQSYFTAYRDPSTSRNTLKGTTGGVDITSTSNITINSATLSLGDTTSEVTAQDNFTVNDNLTVNTNTLYVDSTSERIGVGTLDPTHTLTVSGTPGSASYIPWDGTDLTSISFTNGSDFLVYEPQGATVPTPLTIEGTSVRVLVNGDYYYGTTTSANFFNGRGFWGVTWLGATIQLTDDLTDVISYGGSIGSNHFSVYDDTDVILQVSGSTIYSGTTSLLDMFAPYDVISGGTF